MDELIARFREYAASFKGADSVCDLNIDLKLEHTMRVLDETRSLCAAEGIDARLSRLAGFVALLHDLSRFEQFKESGSFNDAASFDHGDRSVELAARDGWVRELEHREAEAVLTAICWHNKLAVPGDLSPDAALLTRVIRDTDKLDIMRVLLDHFEHPEKNPAVVYSMDRNTRLTPAVAAALAGGRQVDHRDMRTVADFTAATLSWVYDLNFAWSRREFLRRGFIAAILKRLPQDELVSRAAARAAALCRA